MGGDDVIQNDCVKVKKGEVRIVCLLHEKAEVIDGAHELVSRQLQVEYRIIFRW